MIDHPDNNRFVTKPGDLERVDAPPKVLKFDPATLAVAADAMVAVGDALDKAMCRLDALMHVGVRKDASTHSELFPPVHAEGRTEETHVFPGTLPKLHAQANIEGVGYREKSVGKNGDVHYEHPRGHVGVFIHEADKSHGPYGKSVMHIRFGEPATRKDAVPPPGMLSEDEAILSELEGPEALAEVRRHAANRK